jgi:hypothetical protein
MRIFHHLKAVSHEEKRYPCKIRQVTLKLLLSQVVKRFIAEALAREERS